MKAAIPGEMRVAAREQYGDHRTIRIIRKEIPEPGPYDLLVKVEVTAATAADSFLRSGTPKFARIFLGLRKPRNPYIGTAFSGTIVKQGDKVLGFNVDDAVFGETGLYFSANAEYLVVDSREVVCKKPDSLSHEEAACFSDGPLTSFNFIHHVGEAKQGDRILINGGAGALGTAAIQIARAMGCRVVTTSSKENFALLKSLGADETLDYRDDKVFKGVSRYDLIYDTVGKLDYKQIKHQLTPQGRFVSPVLSSNVLWESLKSALPFRKKKVRFEATGMKKPDELRTYLSSLLKLSAGRKLNIHIGHRFELADLSMAHELIDTGHKKGNCIINFKEQNK